MLEDVCKRLRFVGSRCDSVGVKNLRGILRGVQYLCRLVIVSQNDSASPLRAYQAIVYLIHTLVSAKTLVSVLAGQEAWKPLSSS